MRVGCGIGRSIADGRVSKFRQATAATTNTSDNDEGPHLPVRPFVFVWWT